MKYRIKEHPRGWFYPQYRRFWFWWDCWYKALETPYGFRDLKQAKDFITGVEKAKQEAKGPVKYHYID